MDFLKRSFLHSLLIILTSCNPTADFEKSSILESSFVITITSPANIQNSNISSYSLSGTCTDGSGTLSVNVGGVSATTPCTDSVWNTTLDLSTVSDGSVTITMNILGTTNSQTTKTVLKDTTGPIVSGTYSATVNASATNSPSLNFNLANISDKSNITKVEIAFTTETVTLDSSLADENIGNVFDWYEISNTITQSSGSLAVPSTWPNLSFTDNDSTIDFKGRGSTNIYNLDSCYDYYVSLRVTDTYGNSSIHTFTKTWTNPTDWSTDSWTSDASLTEYIDSTKSTLYTHTVSVNEDQLDIGGVNFDSNDPGMVYNIDFILGAGSDRSSKSGDLGNTGTLGTNSDLLERSFFFNKDNKPNQILTLDGLDSTKRYRFTWFQGDWDGGGGAPQITITPNDGGSSSVAFDRDSHSIQNYYYTGATSIAFTVSSNTTDTPHFYAFVNRACRQ